MLTLTASLIVASSSYSPGSPRLPSARGSNRAAVRDRHFSVASSNGSVVSPGSRTAEIAACRRRPIGSTFCKALKDRWSPRCNAHDLTKRGPLSRSQPSGRVSTAPLRLPCCGDPTGTELFSPLESPRTPRTFSFRASAVSAGRRRRAGESVRDSARGPRLRSSPGRRRARRPADRDAEPPSRRRARRRS